jgi:hypothetical protein
VSDVVVVGGGLAGLTAAEGLLEGDASLTVCCLLLHCCYTVVALLSQCCYTAAEALLEGDTFWYLLSAICYLLSAICYLLSAVCCLLFAICCLLFAIYSLLSVIC